jgi:predicted TIM-barrel fold metal-dependent hydrolase
VIINCHTHLGYTFALQHNEQAVLHAPLGEDFVRVMDEHGVDKVCASSVHYTGFRGNPYDPDYDESNRQVAHEARKFPDRLIPFYHVNPNFTDRIVDQMKRGYEEWGFRGLGELNPLTEHFQVNDLRLMEPLMRYCADYHWPVHFHAGNLPTCQAALFAPLAKAFPEVNIIIGHIAYAYVEDSIAVAQRFPNVYVEPAGNGSSPAIRHLIDNLPAEKIIYGDDLPFSFPIDVMDKFRHQPGVSEEDKALMLGGNMARLLGLAP